ncbi:MAG: hypothetical protein RLZZ628_554 [Bacteroidota bacterium]|jgi:hypothetical protein
MQSENCFITTVFLLNKALFWEHIDTYTYPKRDNAKS